MLSRRREDGFTLVELVIAVAILGVIMMALAAAMIVALKATAESEDRMTGTSDERLASAYFGEDVQGANTMASSGTPKCTSGDASDVLVVDLIGSDFDPTTLAPETTVISYVYRPVTAPGGTVTRELHRLVCATTDAIPVYPLTAGIDSRVSKKLSTTVAPVTVCKNAAAVVVACSSATATSVVVTVTEANGVEYNLAGDRRTS